MKTRFPLLILLTFCFLETTLANKKAEQPINERKQWADLCYKIAQPILENMSKGELQKNMQLELSPTWDGRDKRVSYMEAFGRLMAGISPWLALPDDGTAEGKQRSQLQAWALQSYKNAVDPQSPDYLLWEGPTQILVDAAYIAESFLRAPKTTWELLDLATQQRYIECFKGLRTIRPAYNNWLLFRAMTEAFLLSIDEETDRFALTVAVNKINEWYLSDGFYSDGPEFALDYYNSYVMHPMQRERFPYTHQFGIGHPANAAIQLLYGKTYFSRRYLSGIRAFGSLPDGSFSITFACCLEIRSARGFMQWSSPECIKRRYAQHVLH